MRADSEMIARGQGRYRINHLSYYRESSCISWSSCACVLSSVSSMRENSGKRVWEGGCKYSCAYLLRLNIQSRAQRRPVGIFVPHSSISNVLIEVWR